MSRVSTFASVRSDAANITSNRAFANDSLYSGIVNAPVDAEVMKPAFVERLGLDLDETQAPLRAYKQIKAIIPQITAIDANVNINVKLGYTMHQPRQQVHILQTKTMCAEQITKSTLSLTVGW